MFYWFYVFDLIIFFDSMKVKISNCRIKFNKVIMMSLVVGVVCFFFKVCVVRSWKEVREK